MKEASENSYHSMLIKMTDMHNNKEEIKKQKKKNEAKGDSFETFLKVYKFPNAFRSTACLFNIRKPVSCYRQ